MKIPAALFILSLLGWIFLPFGLVRVALFGVMLISLLWLAIRTARMFYRGLVWRLRNRLLVTYLFIAAVPVALVVAMAAVAAYAMVSQLAVYLVTSELDRRIQNLAQTGHVLAGISPDEWSKVAPAVLGDRDVEALVRVKARVLRYPANSQLAAPPAGLSTTQGVLLRDGRPYLWSFQRSGDASLTLTEPVTPGLLASLTPRLGIVGLLDQTGKPLEISRPAVLPDPVWPLDRPVGWQTSIRASVWDRPTENVPVLLAVRTRVSAMVQAMFGQESDLSGTLLALMGALASLLLIVVAVAVTTGATMTRTITAAVHDLYEGTQQVSKGDFTHRIEVGRPDQLGELSQSFNTMTGQVEHLLTVAKEKERLESEVAIAREVQRHLYPRTVPDSKVLKLAGMCHPARSVSGDYFDYAALGSGQIALALGDVAGKGISAALLMASLQSGLRSGWQSTGDRSTAEIVSQLNKQLYASTAPEKYATFFLGIFDESIGVLTYTNGGHLPPILIRKGAAQRLDVNGMVVGILPFSKYDQSYLPLEQGDLLVLFSDGVTEPENTFGEMFGEERLEELLLANAHRPEDEIMQEVYLAVEKWTGGGELQDDLSLLLARRL